MNIPLDNQPRSSINLFSIFCDTFNSTPHIQCEYISEVETNIHTGLEPVPGVPGGGVPVAPYIVHDCPYVGIPITILLFGIP